MREINISDKKSMEIMRRAITEQRIHLLRIIKKEKPISIKALSKSIEKDYGNLYRDIMILKDSSLIKLKKTDQGSMPIVDYETLLLKVKL